MRGAVDDRVVFVAFVIRISGVLAKAVAFVYFYKLVIRKITLKRIKSSRNKFRVKASQIAVLIRIKKRLRFFCIGDQHGGIGDRSGLFAFGSAARKRGANEHHG